jgi:hypothetical protein
VTISAFEKGGAAMPVAHLLCAAACVLSVLLVPGCGELFSKRRDVRFHSVAVPLQGRYVATFTVAPLDSDGASFGVAVGRWGSNDQQTEQTSFNVEALQHQGELRCHSPQLGQLLPRDACSSGPTKPLKVTLRVAPGTLEYLVGDGNDARTGVYSIAKNFPSANYLQFRVVSSGVALHDVRVRTEQEVLEGDVSFQSPVHRLSAGGDVIRFKFTPEKMAGPASFGVIVRPGEQRFMVSRLVTATGEHRCVSNNSALPAKECSFGLDTLLSGAAVKISIATGRLVFMKGAAGWSLFESFPSDVTNFTFASSGLTISELSIVSKEHDWRAGHIRAGASQSDANSDDCGPSSASCGGSCWGVCLNCGPPRYCMCYPKGYMGVSGVFHPGVACLKHDGEGETAEAPLEAADTARFKAYAGGGQEPAEKEDL